MTTELLDLTELAARAGVHPERLDRYVGAGLLPAAHRAGGRAGFAPREAGVVRMLAGAEDLGLDTETLRGLTAAWHDEDCAGTRSHLRAAVTDRLDRVQSDIADRQRRMAGSDPRTGEWAEATRQAVPLFEDAARLQAVAEALTRAAHDGPCGDTCGCTAALVAAPAAYRFPSEGPDAALSCDLVADGGDAHDRIDVWQRALSRAERRDRLPDHGEQAGMVLRFPFDVELAATLARLAASEYRCCAFGSYTLVIDGAGLRLEIRMPVEAADTMAAVVGLPDPPVEEDFGAAHQP